MDLAPYRKVFLFCCSVFPKPEYFFQEIVKFLEMREKILKMREISVRPVPKIHGSSINQFFITTGHISLKFMKGKPIYL